MLWRRVHCQLSHNISGCAKETVVVSSQCDSWNRRWSYPDKNRAASATSAPAASYPHGRGWKQGDKFSHKTNLRWHGGLFCGTLKFNWSVHPEAFGLRECGAATDHCGRLQKPSRCRYRIGHITKTGSRSRLATHLQRTRRGVVRS